MRKQLLSVFLPMLVLGLVASATEMPASQPASQHNELQRVNVVRGADEIRVVISARGAVTPKLSTADSPARLVVDLPGTVMATGQTHIAVGSAGVKGVRIGMDGQTPPTTRVVVDLEHALRYELTPLTDGKLVLTLHTQPTAAASMQRPTNRGGELADAQQDYVSVRAASDGSAGTQGADGCGQRAGGSESGDGERSASHDPEVGDGCITSSDFVFVEPTFQAKKTVADATTTADATEEPGERAQEAAAKFADKTAAELLPVSANAAQSSQSTSSSTGMQPAVNLAAEQRAQAGQAAGRGWSQVHGRADFSESEGCGSERLLPVDPRNQRLERGARSQCARHPDRGAR